MTQTNIHLKMYIPYQQEYYYHDYLTGICQPHLFTTYHGIQKYLGIEKWEYLH